VIDYREIIRGVLTHAPLDGMSDLVAAGMLLLDRH
jgi:hypothetical protein